MAEAVSDAIQRGYEPDQPHLRGIALGALAVVVAVLIAMAAGYLMRPPRAATSAADAGRTPLSSAAGPRLQATPERDFPAFHEEKARIIQEYGWVDRAHGVVRIPIERAMALLVERQPPGPEAK